MVTATCMWKRPVSSEFVAGAVLPEKGRRSSYCRREGLKGCTPAVKNRQQSLLQLLLLQGPWGENPKKPVNRPQAPGAGFKCGKTGHWARKSRPQPPPPGPWPNCGKGSWKQDCPFDRPSGQRSRDCRPCRPKTQLPALWDQPDSGMRGLGICPAPTISITMAEPRVILEVGDSVNPEPRYTCEPAEDLKFLSKRNKRRRTTSLVNMRLHFVLLFNIFFSYPICVCSSTWYDDALVKLGEAVAKARPTDCWVCKGHPQSEVNPFPTLSHLYATSPLLFTPLWSTLNNCFLTGKPFGLVHVNSANNIGTQL
ncbi:uncharacterized protein LOC122739284 [Dromiciops gliroides]|uniref:uncharacterized protein LOC122739284 n=1 Tax=Dromiciops gliroides TaxID=33562 RepID=UPI001CC6D694|nr:uncharacterized protein LOC122739284 [Dromiciops gliroides]